ncbi:MAG TPA: hypothetical protein VGH81_14305 [Rudaea sp.]|jgi:hypothetical protein
MHRRIVLGKSLAPFVAVAIFPAAATAAMTGPVLSGSAANESGKRFVATTEFRAAPTPVRRMAT